MAYQLDKFPNETGKNLLDYYEAMKQNEEYENFSIGNRALFNYCQWNSDDLTMLGSYKTICNTLFNIKYIKFLN